MRTAIHAHGCARLKNDPDIIGLTASVYAAKMIKAKHIPFTEEDSITQTEYFKILKIGDEAEERVITYVDTLITAINPRESLPEIIQTPDPHPCCIDINLLNPEEYDEDYLQILNCTQRHVCRVDGYCKSKKSNLKNKCRFGYPFEKLEKSEIMFTETKTRVLAEINLARNDVFMNPHNRMISHNWRANTDLQAIIDYLSAQNYICKYATKG